MRCCEVRVAETLCSGSAAAAAAAASVVVAVLVSSFQLLPDACDCLQERVANCGVPNPDFQQSIKNSVPSGHTFKVSLVQCPSRLSYDCAILFLMDRVVPVVSLGGGLCCTAVCYR